MLSELVIFVIVWEWSQDYEWYVYYLIVLKVGIKFGIVDVIVDGCCFIGMSEDEEIVYDFMIELICNKCVVDGIYVLVEKCFGNKGIVDMIGICGYYMLFVMEMNVV